MSDVRDSNEVRDAIDEQRRVNKLVAQLQQRVDDREAEIERLRADNTWKERALLSIQDIADRQCVVEIARKGLGIDIDGK